MHSVVKNKNYNPNKILYSLNVEDFQNVSLELIGRKLNNQEIDMVLNKVEYYINWDEAIGEGIKEVLPQEYDSYN